jgi:hypothetical protein
LTLFGKHVWNSCQYGSQFHVAQLHQLANAGSQALYFAYVYNVACPLAVSAAAAAAVACRLHDRLWVCQVPWPAEHMGVPVGVLADILAGVSAG